MLNRYSQNNYSRFWIDSQNTNMIDKLLGIEHEKVKGRDLVALASYRRAVGNFVNIVTGKSIPVEFNSHDSSYTDGKKVVLGANLNDKNFDVAVGLALHEGSHILLSDFDLLNSLSAHITDNLYEKAEKLGIGRNETLSRAKRILNYIEDKRIDYYIFKTSPGYKGYYHAMYEKYHYNKVIDKALKSAEYRIEDWNSYDFRLINLENSNRQLNALNGLRDIWNEINLPRIFRLTSSSDVLKVALKVYDIILDNINPIIKPKNSSSKEDENGKLNEREGGDEMGPGNTSSNKNRNDDGSELTEMTESQKKQLPKIIEKQKDFVDGNIKKTKLSKKDARSMNSLEASGATYEEVGEGASWSGEKVKCLVVKDLTKNLINSEVFSCATKWNYERYDNKYGESNFVEEGLRLGSILGKKLKVRSEERVTKYTRKDAGKIDKRMLAELGFGNTNIFSQTLVDKYNKAYLHISIDASGSMYGKKWNKAMTSAVAMIKACDMAGNIDVVVSIRTTHHTGTNRYNGEVPLIMVVFDSQKDKLTKVRTLFKALRPTGTTPEGLCFEAIAKDLIPGNNNQDSYFINYSDGCPIFSSNNYNYSGHSAEQHTKKQVNKMRNLGLKVISYFIDEHDRNRDSSSFKTMYGKDAHFINATNMMEVARTMNKKFLEK
jgi:hypothetical protein